MKEQLISSETAKLAKEKGFDEKCLFFYTGDSKELKQINLKGISNSDTISFCSAPTQSLLQKWLREKHGIDILVQRSFSNGIKTYILTPCFDKPIPKGYESVEKNNYEEALEIALFKSLKYII